MASPFFRSVLSIGFSSFLLIFPIRCCSCPSWSCYSFYLFYKSSSSSYLTWHPAYYSTIPSLIRKTGWATCPIKLHFKLVVLSNISVTFVPHFFICLVMKDHSIAICGVLSLFTIVFVRVQVCASYAITGITHIAVSFYYLAHPSPLIVARFLDKLSQINIFPIFCSSIVIRVSSWITI